MPNPSRTTLTRSDITIISTLFIAWVVLALAEKGMRTQIRQSIKDPYQAAMTAGLVTLLVNGVQFFLFSSLVIKAPAIYKGVQNAWKGSHTRAITDTLITAQQTTSTGADEHNAASEEDRDTTSKIKPA